MSISVICGPQFFSKEAKESRYWLKLVDTNENREIESERNALINESTELMNIFGSILQKFK